MRKTLFAWPLLLWGALAVSQPLAPVQEVTETLHGVPVRDPYRYMETPGDPATRAWMLGQGQFARHLLDRIEGRAQLQARVAELGRGLGDRRFNIVRTSGGALFYLYRGRDERQTRLMMRPALDGPEQLLVDPETHARRTGLPHAINYFSPSWDGRYVAYGLSAGGSEDASLHVLDVKTGQPVGQPLPRASWSDVSWLPDSKSFTFNQLRELAPGEPASETYLDSTVRWQRVGAPPEQARGVFGPVATPGLGLRRLDNGRLLFAPGSPWVIAATNDTTQKEGSVFVARVAELGQRQVNWVRLASFDDHWVEIELKGHHVYYRTKVGAPRFRIMKLDLRRPQAARAIPVAEAPPEGLIESFVLGRDEVMARVRQGANIVLRRYRAGDTAGQPVDMPFPGAASVADDPAHAHREYLYQLAGWTQPAQGFLLQGAQSRPLPAFTVTPPPGLPEVEVADVLVRSHDGVQVPMTILHRKGLARDGRNPTLLLGYGSYGLSQTAGFRYADMAWLEQGGVLAIANVRGSGVYGDPWRMAGTGPQKPNTWKDGIACAQYLIDQGYATPATLAITGGSAGGIFAGRAITAAPQLFAAAVIHVGLLDALRAEHTANGITNISEFGSTRDPEGFRALLEMSTYHQIQDGKPYPAVMLVHGLNDPRVDAWNSGKVAARLQAASNSGKPVLLRVDAQDGHGRGRTPAQASAVSADSFSFLWWQMGKRKLAD